jgi:UDP-glucose 4-epimerase
VNILITGGAGFIGSNLTGKLLEQGHRVVCVDDFTLGNEQNVARFADNADFQLIRQDASEIEALQTIMEENKIEYIFHLAANSDIQKSAANPGIDFTKTFSTTYSVLECMRRCGVKKMFFASTSAVYGEKVGVALKEDIGGLAPISYYGGAKLASEAFISSYAYMNDLDVMVFRFPNVIGPGLTHGVIFDFIRKLQDNPKELQILGDGTQNKPYIYVEDLVEAIIRFSFAGEKGVNIYNMGVEGSTSVKKIADFVCEAMELTNVEYKFTGGNRGWKGDVPAFCYDLSKIHATGWKAAHNSDESVQATLKAVLHN